MSIHSIRFPGNSLRRFPQNDESEEWIGEWMASRNVRDRVIIATKYTTDYKLHSLGKNEAILFGGNHKRSLHMSVRDSLKKLQTDWIDILYVHWWDFTTSIKEVMDSLHILVEQGKVLYLGVSGAFGFFRKRRGREMSHSATDI